MKISICPTRWTIHGETCVSIDELMNLWKWSLADKKDTKMAARIFEAQAFMKTFKFMSAPRLGEVHLRETDNLPKS